MLTGGHPASRSFKEVICPADVLLYSSIAVAIPGIVLMVAGITLALINSGASGHYALTYVGLTVFSASVITGSVAIKRIVQTNRYLKELGLSASEFISQWNSQRSSLSFASHENSFESELTISEPEHPNLAQYQPHDRLPMPPRRAVL